MGFETQNSLANHLLIAMPTLNDPGFEGSVTLICEHSAEGAVGMVINKPTSLRIGEVFKELELADLSTERAEQPVLAGGPVSRDRGFVIHNMAGDFESTLQVSSDLKVSFAPDILTALAQSDDSTPALFGLGYAGWASGQLEDELLDNAWLTAPASNELLFDTDFEQRWSQAARSIGVDLDRLAPMAGHD